MLVPPGVAGADVAQRVFTPDVAAAKGECAISDSGVRIDRRKGKLLATVDRDALAKQQAAGWLSDWSIRAESQGCVPVGSGEKLAFAVAESVPLDAEVPFRLLRPSFRSGYVDLTGGDRLEVRSSTVDAKSEIVNITGSGNSLNVDLKAAPGAAAPAGFEIDWYAVEPNAGRPGYHLKAIAAERTTYAGKQQLDAPSADFFHFPPEAAYFRLFYKTDDNGVTAIVVSGTSREDLDRRTKRLAADITQCGAEPALCRELPHRVGINPYMAVDVNGKTVNVGIGATVHNAILTTGIHDPSAVLPTLHVTRPFAGRSTEVEFDRASRDILSLRLLGGEKLTWQ